MLIGTAAVYHVRSQLNLLYLLNLHFQTDFFHIGGDLPGIHGIALGIAEGIAVVLADGLDLFRQINLHPGVVDGIHHRGRAANGHGIVVQYRVLRVIDIILGAVASPLDLNRDLRYPSVVHVHINGAGILVSLGKGAGRYVAGEGNGITQGDVLSRLLQPGQVYLRRQFAGIQLA